MASADALAFIAPVHFCNFPAILRGWIERVFTYGFAYGLTEAAWRGDVNGRLPLLHHKRALIMTSTLFDEAAYDAGIRDAMDKVIDEWTFRYPGIKTSSTSTSTPPRPHRLTPSGATWTRPTTWAGTSTSQPNGQRPRRRPPRDRRHGPDRRGALAIVTFLVEVPHFVVGSGRRGRRRAGAFGLSRRLRPRRSVTVVPALDGLVRTVRDRPSRVQAARVLVSPWSKATIASTSSVIAAASSTSRRRSRGWSHSNEAMSSITSSSRADSRSRSAW